MGFGCLDFVFLLNSIQSRSLESLIPEMYLYLCIMITSEDYSTLHHSKSGEIIYSNFKIVFVCFCKMINCDAMNTQSV